MTGLIVFICITLAGGAATYYTLRYRPHEDHEIPYIPLEPKLPSRIIPPHMPTKQEQLYTLAKSLIGQHLSLNEAVPWMVGCAEAVSTVMHRFGTPGIPVKGIEGTAALLAFLEASSAFEEAFAYEPGLIIISATGTGNGRVRGHTGICGHDQIMSNNSETGRWGTSWSIHGPASVGQDWTTYYCGYGGIPTRFFRPI